MILPMFVCLDVIRIVISRATIFSRYFTPACWAVLILSGLGLGSLLIKVRPGRKLLWFSGLVSLIIFLVLRRQILENIALSGLKL